MITLNIYCFEKNLDPKYKTLHITLIIIQKIILDELIMN